MQERMLFGIQYKEKSNMEKVELRNVPSRNKASENRIAIPDDILKTLSVKYGKPTHVIEYIIREQFKQLAVYGKRKDMPKIILHHLGIFQVSRNRKMAIKSFRFQAERKREQERLANESNNQTE